MRFRTQLDIRPSERPLRLDARAVTLGSCFSQAIGNRLSDSGMDAAVTPMGILFNPLSIARCVARALDGEWLTEDDLIVDGRGVWHALMFESRRQSADRETLLADVNNDFRTFAASLAGADVWLVTFGTAWCFHYGDATFPVGNCHKLDDRLFRRRMCDVDDIVRAWTPILRRAPRVIFTVSPVRHLNDGLHGNTLSKARLHLAVEKLCEAFDNAEYFPAFEALNDDLRDYRFYADDLKHPSAMAEEYIFDLFCQRYFGNADRSLADENRRKVKSLNHRTIIG